ncbi:MAG: hypothetical protein Q4F00_12835 [bacterium]|nr:hypothetical protein [bacterium]
MNFFNAITPSFLRKTEYAASASGAAPAGSLQQVLASANALPKNDSVKVSAFDNSAKPSTSTQKLNELYQKREAAQQDINNSKQSQSDKESEINNRKEKLIKDKQDGKGESKVQQEYEKAKQEYDDANAKKNTASQEAADAQQKCSAKDAEISKNAGDISAKSGELSAKRSELAAAQAKASQSSSDDGESQGTSNDNSGEIAALQAEINALESELQSLQQQANTLQSEKEQLAGEQQEKQEKVSSLDKELETKQQVMNQCEQQMRADDSDLDKTLNEDSELQNLQEEHDNIKEDLDVKQKELESIEEEIKTAEQNNVELQESRSEYAHGQLEEAAEEAGLDIAESAAGAQNEAAQDKYGKDYDELSDKEKLAIASQVDGEITLDLMETARQRLQDNPDDAEAQKVLEKGSQDLEARQNWAKSNVNNIIDNLPDELQDELSTIQGFAEGNTDAEGIALDSEIMQAISQGIQEKLDSPEYSDEEKEALRDTLNAANAYADAIEQKYAGAEIALNESDSKLAKAKTDMARKLGCSVEDLITVQGTKDNDDIQIIAQEGGALTVNINGKSTDYSAEEAKYLFIDGGNGDDNITFKDPHDVQKDHYQTKADPNYYNGTKCELVKKGITTNLHIYGGDGDDVIYGGAGINSIDGGGGVNQIYKYRGIDMPAENSGSVSVSKEAQAAKVSGGDSDTVDSKTGNDCKQQKQTADTARQDFLDHYHQKLTPEQKEQLNGLQEASADAISQLDQITKKADKDQAAADKRENEVIESLLERDPKYKELYDTYKEAQDNYNKANLEKTQAENIKTAREQIEGIIEQKSRSIADYEAKISDIDRQKSFLNDPEKYCSDQGIPEEDREAFLQNPEKYCLEHGKTIDLDPVELVELVKYLPPKQSQPVSYYNGQTDANYVSQQHKHDKKIQELEQQKHECKENKKYQEHALSSNEKKLADLKNKEQAIDFQKVNDDACAAKQIKEQVQQELENSPELAEALANDPEYQALQQTADNSKRQQEQQWAEVNNLELRTIAAKADIECQDAARQAGLTFEVETDNGTKTVNVDELISHTQNSAAKNKYGKNYTDLTSDEKNAIQAQVVGDYTLIMMESAKQRLSSDPNNAAAQAVVEKGQKSLRIQDDAAFTALIQQANDLPDDVRNEIDEKMNQLISEANNGERSEDGGLSEKDRIQFEKNVAEQLKAYINDQDAVDLYNQTIADLESGQNIIDETPALHDSELATMKQQIADEQNIGVEDIIVLQGTENGDEITVVPRADGGLEVEINGEVHFYNPEEAQRLLISGGNGNDNIKVDDRYHVQGDYKIASNVSPDQVKLERQTAPIANLHIYGGQGDDTIEGGDGNDMLIGGDGKDEIHGGKGFNYVDGGQGNDDIYCDESEGSVIIGGEGDDYIEGSRYTDFIFGGEGNDYIWAGRGDDVVYGQEGDDYIHAGRGFDNVDGGEGEDHIIAFDDGGIYNGGSGDYDDTIETGWAAKAEYTIIDEGKNDHDTYVTQQGKNIIYDSEGYKLNQQGYEATVIEIKNPNEAVMEEAQQPQTASGEQIDVPDCEAVSQDDIENMQTQSEEQAANNQTDKKQFSNDLKNAKEAEKNATSIYKIMTHSDVKSKRQTHFTIVQSLLDMNNGDYDKAAHKDLDIISQLSSSRPLKNYSTVLSKTWSAYDNLLKFDTADASDSFGAAGDTAGNLKSSFEVLQKEYARIAVSNAKNAIAENQDLKNKFARLAMQDIHTVKDLENKIGKEALEKVLETNPGLKECLSGFDANKNLTERVKHQLLQSPELADKLIDKLNVNDVAKLDQQTKQSISGLLDVLDKYDSITKFVDVLDVSGAGLSGIGDVASAYNNLVSGDKVGFIKSVFDTISSSADVAAYLGGGHIAELVSALATLASLTTDYAADSDVWDLPSSLDLAQRDLWFKARNAREAAEEQQTKPSH